MTAGTKRTPDDNIVVGDPYTFLAVAIIDQAYKDLQHMRRTGTILNRNYPVTMTELTGFFKSEWFDELLGAFGLNPDFCRESIGIS